MAQKLVLFDTNSYRGFANGKSTKEALTAIENLRTLEKKKNIRAGGIMVVAMEMLANLVEDENGMNFKDCLNGVQVMIAHTRDEETTAPRIIPQPFLHITNSFFDTVPEGLVNKVKNLVGVADDISRDINLLQHHKDKNTFEDIRNWVDKEEEDFCEHIIGLVEGAKLMVKDKNPNISDKHLREKTMEFINSKSFTATLSYAIIKTAALELGFSVSEDDIWDRANFLVEKFPVSTEFFRWICYQIVDKNIDMRSKTSIEKRWNWQWDYQVSFLVNDQTISGSEVILVTADKEILNLLSASGYSSKVMTLTEYLEYLNRED